MNDASRAPTAPGRADPGQDGLRTFRRLRGYLAPHRGRFILGMLGGVLFSATMVSFALYAKVFVGGTLIRQDPRTIVWMPVALVGLFLLRGIGDFTQTYFMGYVARQIVRRLRHDVFRHLLQLPIGYFDRHSSALLLSRLTYNSEQIGQATTDSVNTAVRTTLTIIGSVGVLLWINARLTLVALIMGPLVGWLVSIINRKFRRYSRRIQDSMGDVTRVAKESLEAPRLIKVYNAQAHLDAQFDVVNEHNRRSNMRLILTKGLSNPVVQQVTAVGSAVVLSIAITDAIYGRMSMAELAAFITALVNIAQPLRDLVGVAGPLQQGIAAGESLFELLDEPVEPQGGSLHVARVRGAVQFEQVSFAYPGAAGAPADSARRPAALSDVDLNVAAGETLAIVGRSGSGKSTLVNLLPRFYDVSAGCVCIDGRDVRDYQLHNLREQIAVVSQDVVLFDDTIRNNIAFGREVPDAEVERAAEAAAHTRVRAQPTGRAGCAGGRSRHAALRWTAPAHRHRARAAEGCADPDPRRGDLRTRYRGRTSYSGRARAAAAPPHYLRHRPPPVHGGAGRTHHRARCRADCRVRHARRAARAGRSVRSALPAAVLRLKCARAAWRGA